MKYGPPPVSPVVEQAMRKRGFEWLSTGTAFLRPGTYERRSREIKFDHGEWLASSWKPYGQDESWDGVPFSDLEACFLDAELQNWGEP